MISQLEEQLSLLCTGKERQHAMVDVTMPLQVLFSNKDRTIVKARARYQGDDSDAWLVMVVGLRSEILSAFNRFEKNIPGRYLPCDIPSLVPSLALMISSYSRGLAISALAKDDITRLILVFEGQARRKGGSLRGLATSVYNFMTRWDEWTEVLLSTLGRDPVVGSWNIDFRELLARESGYVTMPWFEGSTSYMDRAIALERVILASNALLNSVLNSKQMEDPLIVRLKEWLRDLEPFPEVSSSVQIGKEAEI